MYQSEGSMIHGGAKLAFGDTDEISGRGRDPFEDPFGCRTHVSTDIAGGSYVTPKDANLLPEDK